MSSPAVSIPLRVRAAVEPDASPARRFRSAPAPIPGPVRAVWEALGLVVRQQVAQDALLLWRHGLRDDRLELLAATPAGVWAPATPSAPETTIPADDPLRQLSSRHLDLLAHLRCTPEDGEMERVLSNLGLRSAVTTVVHGDDRETLLVTAGFRHHWRLTAPHAPAFAAFIEHLRACQQAALMPLRTVLPDLPAWWELRAQVPTLWQQPYRPSVLRTVHDLMETLAEAARALRPRHDPTALPGPEVALDLAHRTSALMDRLEQVTTGPPARTGFDELLSQALLLVRDAYHLCRGTWPGCLAVVRQRPEAIAGPAGDLRHQLIDWVAHHIEAEHAAE
ncbi:MAG: hypothetical protein KKI08_26425 [Armatimonadetes bacterium]|nr:hypothetical protein [Armatimonadota bacterium]